MAFARIVNKRGRSYRGHVARSCTSALTACSSSASGGGHILYRSSARVISVTIQLLQGNYSRRRPPHRIRLCHCHITPLELTGPPRLEPPRPHDPALRLLVESPEPFVGGLEPDARQSIHVGDRRATVIDRKSTRLNSSHQLNSY